MPAQEATGSCGGLGTYCTCQNSVDIDLNCDIGIRKIRAFERPTMSHDDDVGFAWSERHEGEVGGERSEVPGGRQSIAKFRSTIAR
jgi:hypothetical protein